MMSDAAKNFDILATGLNILHNYFVIEMIVIIL